MAETEVKQIQYLGPDSLRYLSAAISKNYVSHAELELALAGLQIDPSLKIKPKFYRVNSSKKTPSELIQDGNLGSTVFNNGDFLYGIDGDKYILFIYQDSWFEISRSYEEITLPEGGDVVIDVSTATYNEAGTVRPSEEDFNIETSGTNKGLLSLKPISIKKISGLQDELDKKANRDDVYTKSEINELLFSSKSAVDSASLEVPNPNHFEYVENLALPVGTIANVKDPTTGELVGTYILVEENGVKKYKKLEVHDESLNERISNLEDQATATTAWGGF